MASNGKRPREESGRNFTNFRSYGHPILRHRLPSSNEPSDYELSEYDGSSSEDGWTTTTDESGSGGSGSSSMDTDFYDEEEEMMLLDELYGEEEEEDEVDNEEGMDLIGFSSDEDSEYDEAMDRELARVEMEMYRKEQRKKLIPPEMIPDGIDSDDEEAWQFLEDEWICEQEQRILYEQHQPPPQNNEKPKSTATQEPECSPSSGTGPDWDALDVINRRFLIRGNVSGKPCTMTSSVGARRARISMVGTIVPATEMLRNYFRDCRRGGGVKENFGRVPESKVASRVAVRSNGATCQRKALSERNL